MTEEKIRILDLPVDVIYTLISNLRVGQDHPVHSWSMNMAVRHVRRHLHTTDAESQTAINEFCDWAKRNPQELEILLAKRSPRVACNYAIRLTQKRLCPEAEAILSEKKNSRKQKGYVRYCTNFQIIAKNIEQITLEACYGGSEISKEYIKKIQEAKVRCKELIGQIIQHEKISDDISVKELLEILQ